LSIDARIAPENRQAWLFSTTANLLADIVPDLLSPDCFIVHFTNV